MTIHLRPEELVDLAEGTRAEGTAPHLAACARCRRELDDLRAMMASIEQERVPEPSPLFWDHLQQRISEAVAAEGAPSRFPQLAWLMRPRLLMPIGAAAAIAVVVTLTLDSRVTMPPLPDGPAPIASAARDSRPDTSGPSHIELLNESLVDDDPSLQLVADLTATLDANAAGEAGLAPRGSAEHAIAHLSAAELAELQRLLRQELGKRGA